MSYRRDINDECIHKIKMYWIKRGRTPPKLWTETCYASGTLGEMITAVGVRSNMVDGFPPDVTVAT